MDIGGTKARIYEFQEGKRFAQLEIDLPTVDPRITELENGKRRIDAISRLVKYFARKRNVPRVATAKQFVGTPNCPHYTLRPGRGRAELL